LLDRSTVERLRGADTAGHPVVSVYLGLGPDLDQLRSITTRLKGLVHPLREGAEAEASGEEGSRRLRQDLDRAVAMAERVSTDRGRGAALFVCSAAGMEEHVILPAPVRDRAVVDTTPYLGPLEAMLAHFRRYCAVVIDRRLVSIYRFHMGALESWEVMAEEEVRKDNYGGFAGYSEHRSRGHAEEVARRLFRAVAARLAGLRRADEFDLLAVGGNQANVDGLVDELPADLKARLAGTFTVEPRAAGTAEIRDRCEALAQDYDRRTDERLVGELMEAAGARGRGVVGLDRALDAANQQGIDLLLLDAGETVPGVACLVCGWLARSGAACASCGEPTRRVADLYDAVAEAVRGAGGSVRYVLAATPMAHCEVGAMVRFAVPTVGE
jgi:peptide subunit release factor 1 (eRF1)